MTKTRVRGVYKHKSGGYIARLRRKGVSISRTFASLTSAERWITQTRIGLEDGDLVIRDGEVLSKNEAERQERTLLNRTLDSLINRLIDTGECRVKENHLLTIRAELGSKFVENLTRAECLEFLESHTSGKAPATFNRWRAALHRVMAFAIEVDWRQDNPVTGIKRRSEKGNRRDRVITPNEEKELQEACDASNSQLGLIFALCMATGARVSEITDLTWREVDLGRGTLRLGEGATKNYEPRTLVVRGRALDRLREFAKVVPISQGASVFLADSGSRYDATKQFRKAADKIGDKATLHDCRHTWATRLARVPGMTITQLRDAGGWKSLAMVARYSHEMTDDLADKLEQMLEANQ